MSKRIRAWWKAIERRAAKFIGGERVPVTGRQRGSAPDIKHPWMATEVKARESIPAWIHDAMRQAEASAKYCQSITGQSLDVPQIPVVILVEKGQRIEDAYIFTRLGQWRQWFLE